MFPELNAKDRHILSQRRLKRLRKIFLDPLGLCQLDINDECLAIHCCEPWMVDVLMEDWDYFTEMTRMILGVQSISLRYAGEVVHYTGTEPKTLVAN